MSPALVCSLGSAFLGMLVEAVPQGNRIWALCLSFPLCGAASREVLAGSAGSVRQCLREAAFPLPCARPRTGKTESRPPWELPAATSR